MWDVAWPTTYQRRGHPDRGSVSRKQELGGQATPNSLTVVGVADTADVMLSGTSPSA